MPILFFDFFWVKPPEIMNFLGLGTSAWTWGQGQVQLPTSKWRTLWNWDLHMDFAGVFCQFSGYFQPEMFGICFSWIRNCLGNSVFFSPFEIWAVVRAMAIRKIWCLCGACGNWCPSEKPWNRLEQRERRKFPMRRNCVPLGHRRWGWTWMNLNPGA